MRPDGWPLLALCALLACATRASAAPQAASPQDAAQRFDPIVDAAITRYRLPGIAVGVIEDGRIVYQRTAGETVAGSGHAITPRTRFQIASNTKAMTTALLARLVEQGKLDWKAPVTRYLPDFRMHDPWVSTHMQVADLLTHSSGLPEGGGDLMLWPTPNAYTRADILHGLRYLRPAYGFRSEYRYDNLLYVVAGEVAAAAGGDSYEHLLQREVFQPLGLDGCRIDAEPATATSDVAAPHHYANGHSIPIPRDAPAAGTDTAAAAGGVTCDLDSMLRWARNWLAPTASELAWLPHSQRRILQSPHMPIPVSARRRAWDNSHVMAYGYGWRMADVDGQWVVWHTGTLAGMYSMLLLLPDTRSGFVFMINDEADEARTVLGETLLKTFTDPADTRGIEGWAQRLAQETQASAASAPVPDTARSKPVPPSDLSAYLGRYNDPWLGDALLCATGREVRFSVAKSPRLRGTVRRLGTRHLIHWDDAGVYPDAWLEFQPARADQPGIFHLAKVDPDADFSSDFEDLEFRRLGDCPTSP